MTTKRLKRPRNPIALAKLIGDIVKVVEEWEACEPN